MTKRKVCVVITNRASYGRVKALLLALNQHPRVNLQLVLGASLMLSRFGEAVEIIKRDGFTVSKTLTYMLEGDTLSTQAKSTGLGIQELASVFEDLQPELVVTVADRFETMATAIAASYMNIPLAHIQGGELSGNIDDKVRHAVTKLADVHFPATSQAEQRLIQMGENADKIFNYGCPSIDLIKAIDNLDSIDERIHRYSGVGNQINWDEDYILMLQHPVTTSFGDGFKQILATLNSLKTFTNIQKVVLWPNIDAGTDDVSKGIRIFRENNYDANFHYYKNFEPEIYAKVLNNAICAVGNSSSFIREGSYLGTPVVLIGDRQRNREHGQNVLFSDHDESMICSSIKSQIAHGKYQREFIFGSGEAGVKIADQLATEPLTYIKSMSY